MAIEAQLAIVIPAYKAEFLTEALASLAAQTDKRFKVYVGDDASPGPLGEICAEFGQALDLTYRRFAENRGRSSLVEQWHRCIELSSEPWVWLFSDDDVMEPGCVEAFHQALERTEAAFDLYRFNTLTIDDDGQTIEICPPHPPVETGLEFAYHRLCKNRSSFISEYIFSRQTFEANGGLVAFPLAWCSDDASWISFSGGKGISTIYGPRVCWRKSLVNISFAAPSRRREKLEACGRFLDWLNRKFDPATIRTGLQIEGEVFLGCQRRWLLSQIRNQAPLYPGLWWAISRNENFSCLGSRAGRVLSMALIDLNFFLSRTMSLLRNQR